MSIKILCRFERQSVKSQMLIIVLAHAVQYKHAHDANMLWLAIAISDQNAYRNLIANYP